MPPNKTSIEYTLGLRIATILVLASLLYTGRVSAQAPEGEQSPDLSTRIDTAPNFQGDNPPPPVAPFDHSAFASLQQDFATPQDITKTCLSCHIDAANQVMHTSHWTWEFVNEITGQTLGKKNVINNFCVATDSNEPRCTSCHVGYGWADNTFDFTIQENVDCLVCHDTTSTYKKIPTGAGAPVEGLDMNAIAQNVGLTSRETCGTCHFYGGGGDEVKHGDLDSSLVNPDFNLDVHMDTAGLDFSCTNCHATEEHDIPGSRYSMDPEEWKGCESCHTSEPHQLSVLNTHSQNVACQTCHVPKFARGGIPTKMTWDWSTAGQKTEDGELLVLKDEDGNISYHGLKGDFTWEEDVVPAYVWFNGTVEYTLLEDTIDPTQIVSINKFNGNKDDANAKIWPVKHFLAIQPYDSVNNTLVVPHLFGKDETAYWANFDWDKAINAGMDYASAPYSGSFGFIETEMYWPITHMIAPASEALQCQDCHTEEGGRLDFTSLGYEKTDTHRLTNFPPTMTEEVQSSHIYVPDNCVNCHKDQYNLWTESKHGEVGTGCVACHQLKEEGEHPVVAFSIDKTGELCGNCHLKQYNNWKISLHGEKLITCSTCHEPHTQEMRMAPEKTNICENCHLSKAGDVAHSTHTLAGITCIKCHVNTAEDTGHTFEVDAGTCLECHGKTIHTSSHIAELMGGVVDQYNPKPAGAIDVKKAEQATVESKTDLSGEAKLNLPTWAMVALGMIIGVSGYWVIAGKNPGSEHPENAPDIADKDEIGS